MIGIVDYGMGNLGSVANALAFLGAPARILAGPAEMAACRAVILPGDEVRGHFRVLPGEILHLPNKPIELRREGIGFAAQRLAQLVRDGAKVNGQIDVFEVPRAA